MPRFPHLAALFALALAMSAPGWAGEAQDRLFALGMLDPVPTSARLVYRHAREGAAPATVPQPITDGSVEIVLRDDAEGRSALVTIRDGASSRALDPLPAGGGHPLLLVFLETIVRSVAAATGGSPFYIRNRMREALAAQDDLATIETSVGGVAGPGTRLTFRPFVADRNAEQLGPFADLTLTIELADAAPAQLARLEIAAGPAAAPVLRESMEFDRMEEF